MYKLLVADDEKIVLDAIKFIIEKNFKEQVTVQTARSGREAIEKAEEDNPDIIFMDIKMPGINGIDAIREIKSRYKSTLFVIITAYEHFDFAKEAVELGVIGYLLKPVNREKIVEVTNKAITQIDAARENRKKELELKEKIENILPVLESGFIYSVLLFEDHKNDIESYKEIFSITESCGYIMVVEFGEEESPGKLVNRIGVSVKGQSFYPYFSEVIKHKCKCIVGPVMLNRVVVYIPSDKKSDEYSQRIEALGIADYVIGKLSKEVDVDFYIGIGSNYEGVENISRSYEESLKAIKYANNKGAAHFMDLPERTGADLEYPSADQKILLKKISSGETGSSIQLFSQIFEWLVSKYNGSVNHIKEKLLELVVLIHCLQEDSGIDDIKYNEDKHYIEGMLEIDDIFELKTWIRDRIEYISHTIKNTKEKRICSVILNAKEFIDMNYSKELTLEDVSREVNISPHYFSKLFKDETDKNFIEYLTEIRIGKAKELLEEGQHSIKEICYTVGYGDPNYFSRIFKKIVGVTPTEYRDNSII